MQIAKKLMILSIIDIPCGLRPNSERATGEHGPQQEIPSANPTT